MKKGSGGPTVLVIAPPLVDSCGCPGRNWGPLPTDIEKTQYFKHWCGCTGVLAECCDWPQETKWLCLSLSRFEKWKSVFSISCGAQ